MEIEVGADAVLTLPFEVEGLWVSVQFAGAYCPENCAITELVGNKQAIRITKV
jgi:hypothetical protein